jgi:hypothetical protein
VVCDGNIFLSDVFIFNEKTVQIHLKQLSPNCNIPEVAAERQRGHSISATL